MPFNTRLESPLDDVQWPEYLATPLDPSRSIVAAEPRLQLESSSQADSDLRNVRPGNGTVSLSGGEFTVSTPAQTDGAQALETAQIIEYDAGLKGEVGMYIEYNSDPVGFREWGLGGDAFSDELLWRHNSDGTFAFVRERAGTRATIPESDWDEETNGAEVTDTGGNTVGHVWGIDPLDGSGPSGVDIHGSFLGVFSLEMVLYGGGGVAPCLMGQDRKGRVRKVFPFIFRPANESILTQFNAPLVARVDNDGTATADSFVVRERQYLHYGVSRAPNRATPDARELTNLGISTPEAVIGIRREAAGNPTRLDILNAFIHPDNECHVWYLSRPTVTNSPTWGRPQRDFSGNLVADNETSVEVSTDLTVDASTGVAVQGNLLEGGNWGKIGAATVDLQNAVFVRDEPVVLMVESINQDVGTIESVINIQEGL